MTPRKKEPRIPVSITVPMSIYNYISEKCPPYLSKSRYLSELLTKYIHQEAGWGKEEEEE